MISWGYFWHNKFILLKLSFVFAVNFFQGWDLFSKQILILSDWYYEYIKNWNAKKIYDYFNFSMYSRYYVDRIRNCFENKTHTWKKFTANVKTGFFCVKNILNRQLWIMQDVQYSLRKKKIIYLSWSIACNWYQVFVINSSNMFAINWWTFQVKQLLIIA